MTEPIDIVSEDLYPHPECCDDPDCAECEPRGGPVNNHLILAHCSGLVLAVMETDQTFTDPRHDGSRFISAVLTPNQARTLAADLIRRADEVDS